MNISDLRAYIQKYKDNFQSIHKEEIYKWQAIKHFQDHWDINDSDFYTMLKTAIALTRNLLDSGNYFPKKMLLRNAEKSPEQMRELFIFLFEEEFDLIERVIYFQDEFSKISQSNFPELKSTFQDHRAIMVYLNLRYPERYYLYKFTMFKDFAVKISHDYKPVKGRLENIGQFLSLCRLINYELNNDQQLLKLHKDRISDDCYYDKNGHILTQDFIYAVSSHLSISGTSEKVKDTIPISTKAVNSDDIQNQEQHVDLTPRLVNHLENMTEKKQLGELGEKWVLRLERDRLRKAGKNKLSKAVKHISSEKGDGAGFDILSFNEDGTPRFIEVKTTKGDYSQTIYITRNELEKSKLEKENYFLYRVYNFNSEDDTAELLVINGSLTSLCVFPTAFKLNLKANFKK